MAALLIVRRGADIVGECGALCHQAKGLVCACVCEGVNHGVGYEQALANTRAGVWTRPGAAVEIGIPAQHDPLFELPPATEADTPPPDKDETPCPSRSPRGSSPDSSTVTASTSDATSTR